jgi:hypothetical protein
LRDLLPKAILDYCVKFFGKWKSMTIFKFHKKEILFDYNSSSSACFAGVYFRAKGDKVFVAYKFIKNAFKLAKDIYVVHETES